MRGRLADVVSIALPWPLMANIRSTDRHVEGSHCRSCLARLSDHLVVGSTHRDLLKNTYKKKIQSWSGLQGRPSIGKRHGKVKAISVIFTSFIEIWWASTKMVASIFCFFLSVSCSRLDYIFCLFLSVSCSRLDSTANLVSTMNPSRAPKEIIRGVFITSAAVACYCGCVFFHIIGVFNTCSLGE